MKNKNKKVLLTRDNFLKVLSFDVKKRSVINREETDQLFNLMVDFLREKNAIDQESDSGAISTDLDFMIPGTTIHLRITTNLKEDLNALFTAYLVWLGFKQDSAVAVTGPILISLLARMRNLKIEIGEVCIVQVLSEIDEKTSKSVCAALFGKACRYPASRCQFKKRYICHMALYEVEKTMEAMESMKVLKKMNHVEPILWSIIV